MGSCIRQCVCAGAEDSAAALAPLALDGNPPDMGAVESRLGLNNHLDKVREIQRVLLGYLITFEKHRLIYYSESSNHSDTEKYHICTCRTVLVLQSLSRYSAVLSYMLKR